MKRALHPRDLLIEHPIIDVAIAAALIGSHLTVVLKYEHGDVIGWIKAENRHELYGIGAAVIAIIFGFAAAAVSHYATASGSRAHHAKAEFGAILRRQWMGTLVLPGLSAFACLLALALDLAEGGGPTIARWIFESAVILSLIKFIRAMYLFQVMLDVTDLDGIDQGRVPAPNISPAWLDKPDQSVLSKTG
ncbi:hypothetical protein [Streptosporangium sp. NPDC023615]|uniref:hypothetical protein n=1 Tax=Streptosporangium sp. NPDC023615 TaxID=3154794 RepID=UPI003441CECE